MKPWLLAALASLAWLQLRAQDVSNFTLLKSLSYTQSTAGLPLPLATPYRAEASADTIAGGLISGSIGIPGGAVVTLSQDDPTSWTADAEFPTQNAMEAVFPGGNYTINFKTAHDGTKKLSLAFPTGVFPNAPQIVNFQAAQSVLATTDFSIIWTPFSGGKATDYVQLAILTQDGREVFRTAGYGLSGALNGTSTSVAIPGGTLTSGVVYAARVLFARPSGQTFDYGLGVVGVAAYYTETQFPISTVGAPDVKSLGVVKGLRYRQTGPGAPALVDANPYAFRIFAETGAGTVPSATVRLPNGTTQPFIASNDEFGIAGLYTSGAGLDAAYPPGSYTITLNTAHNGTKTVTLPLPASTFPNAPQLLNFAAAQGVDPTRAFAATWNAFAGGGAGDFIQLQISSPTTGNTVFESPQPGQPGALTGTATSVTIPAGTLNPGTTYQASLIFARLLARDTTYTLGFSAYFSQTETSLVTAGNAIAPTLSINRVGPFQWHLHANGALGENYLIESTTSLTAPISWQPMVNFNGSQAGFDFTDGIVHTQNFYRVRPVN